MSLPTLVNWLPTGHALHKVAHLLGAIRLYTLPHVPTYHEYALKVTPEGLSSDLLPNGYEVLLNLAHNAVTIRREAGDRSEIDLPLAGQSQASIFEAILAALGLTDVTADANQSRIDSFRAAMAAHGKMLIPRRDELADPAPLAPDAQLAHSYGTALYEIFTGIARFRARLLGPITPLVVWPEHFDLSTIWYAGTMDENGPQMNFGFAPFSPGIDYPYLYVTIYPLPADFAPPALPNGAIWLREPWRGVVVPYDVIAAQDTPALFIENSCLAIYKAFAHTLG